MDSKILGNRIAWDKKNYSFSLFRIYGAPRKPTFPIGFHRCSHTPVHIQTRTFKRSKFQESICGLDNRWAVIWCRYQHRYCYKPVQRLTLLKGLFQPLLWQFLVTKRVSQKRCFYLAIPCFQYSVLSIGAGGRIRTCESIRNGT